VEVESHAAQLPETTDHEIVKENPDNNNNNNEDDNSSNTQQSRRFWKMPEDGSFVGQVSYVVSIIY
jgi:hypothetical protein